MLLITTYQAFNFEAPHLSQLQYNITYNQYEINFYLSKSYQNDVKIEYNFVPM